MLTKLTLTPTAHRSATAWRQLSENPLLSLRQVAEALGVSVYTARRWAHSGRLPFALIGNRIRVRRDDALAMVRFGEGHVQKL